jgi:hypothetical protein
MVIQICVFLVREEGENVARVVDPLDDRCYHVVTPGSSFSICPPQTMTFRRIRMTVSSSVFDRIRGERLTLLGAS